jgi:hypothetical protein
VGIPVTPSVEERAMTRVERSLSAGALGLMLLAAGTALLLIGLLVDWVALLARLGFPANELSNRWLLGDLRVVRGVCALLGVLLALSGIGLWRSPRIVARFANRLDRAGIIDSGNTLLVPMMLTTLVTTQTILQLVLYLNGYTAFSADDFGRPLSAAFWLRHQKFDLGMDGWLGLAGSGWLSFSDYLFGAALAVHPDLFVTPRIVNLMLSSLAVITVYVLGRELFGRTVGLVTALLFAFQPWIVWLGMSGMSSDLPCLVTIPLFGAYLIRWLRTDRSAALLAAAGFLTIANGFRYESWFLAAATSILIVLLGAWRWRRGVLTRQWAAGALGGLILLNVLPVVWMAASYIVYGDWLPALHGINAFMVAGMTSQTVRTETQMGIPLMAAGSFPFEIVLSVAGVALLPRSYRSTPLRLYVVLIAATVLLFSIVFRGQLAAWLHIARYLLGFVILALPFAGLLVTQLFRARSPWRSEGVLAACVILLTVATFDISRALNYPAGFPKDAISTGWTLRHLQEIGTVSDRGKILIERGRDFGDLSVVVLANRPDRFVVLNELAYRKMALSGLLANKPALVPGLEGEGVKGTICGDDLRQPACRDSIQRERFDLIILSSPERVNSFGGTFHGRSWNIGRYHIFDVRSVPASQVVAKPGSRASEAVVRRAGPEMSGQ